MLDLLAELGATRPCGRRAPMARSSAGLEYGATVLVAGRPSPKWFTSCKADEWGEVFFRRNEGGKPDVTRVARMAGLMDRAKLGVVIRDPLGYHPALIWAAGSTGRAADS